MLKKTYGTPGLYVSTTFSVNGKNVRVEFCGGVPYGPSRVNARFTTTDSDMQKAIESDPRYGETIFTERVKEIGVQKKVEKKGKVKEYKYVRRFQDAVNVLVTDYGVSMDKLTNKQQLKEQADKVSVSFPNMR